MAALWAPVLVVLGTFGVLLLGGCQAPTADAGSAKAIQAASHAPDVQTLREGDVVKISFPGAPTLDSSQAIRRDGRITLNGVGEIKAAGLTPAELEKQLVQLFASQLVEKDVSVTVISSQYSVYIGGAVLRPSKIVADHPLTLLEAVMEAGGWDAMKADIKAVRVIRNENGTSTNLVINLKEAVDGHQAEPFYLKPADVVYVPERFSWF